MKVPFSELTDRMSRFRAQMDSASPDWEIALIFTKIHLYYFTGTMQDGMLVIPRNNDAVFWVRQSYERAREESRFPDIRKMNSYRDAAREMGALPKTVYLETVFVSIALFQRLQKYFPFTSVKALDEPVAKVRSVKSTYELSLMEHAGKVHRHVLEDCVPGLLLEGIDEVSLANDLYCLWCGKGTRASYGLGCSTKCSLDRSDSVRVRLLRLA